MADQKYALLVDYTYYSGNHAAEIGCKEELGLPLEQFGIKEVQVGPFKKGFFFCPENGDETISAILFH